jgi:hypothetical protein
MAWSHAVSQQHQSFSPALCLTARTQCRAVYWPADVLWLARSSGGAPQPVRHWVQQQAGRRVERGRHAVRHAVLLLPLRPARGRRRSQVLREDDAAHLQWCAPCSRSRGCVVLAGSAYVRHLSALQGSRAGSACMLAGLVRKLAGGGVYQGLSWSGPYICVGLNVHEFKVRLVGSCPSDDANSLSRRFGCR